MKISLRRPLSSYSKVQWLVGLLLRRQKRQFLGASKVGKTLLNVGCGANLAPQFINLDYAWRPGLDVCWDIRRGIPLPAASLNGIYTEHCLEHVSFEDCLRVLNEFHRLLSDGGTVRIVVPDGGLYLQLWAEWQAGRRDRRFPYVGPEGIEDEKEDSVAGFTPMMAVNRIFRGYGHKFCYDEETLGRMLAWVGFKDIRRTAFREGRMTELLIDSELRRPQSLYVEATKQG